MSLLEEVAANDDAAERKEGFVKIVSAVGARTQASHLMQPADCAFNHPAVLSQAATILCVSSRQNGFDVALTELFAVRPRVVGAIALDALRAATWSARLARYGKNRIHQRMQLSDIVRVRAGQRGRERNPIGVGDDVMFAAGFTAICRIGARFIPPCTARTDDGSRPIDLVCVLQMREQRFVDALPHTALLPSMQTTPRRHAASPAEFLRQMLPRQPRLQDEENRRQRFAMVDWLATRETLAAFLRRRQQQLDDRPQLVVQNRLRDDRTSLCNAKRRLTRENQLDHFVRSSMSENALNKSGFILLRRRSVDRRWVSSQSRTRHHDCPSQFSGWNEALSPHDLFGLSTFIRLAVLCPQPALCNKTI